MSEQVGDRSLRRLPLHEEHLRLGARMVGFAGWLMPLAYTSIVEEHLQVRTRAGLFDVSHMGKFRLRGSGALASIDRLVASDVRRLKAGQARYTVLLTERGGIQDDLIVYRREDDVLLIVNAARTDADREWILDHLLPHSELDDLTEIACLLALQGPAALSVLTELSGQAIDTMPAFTLTGCRVAGVEATVMRTGYTGEEGVELLVAADEAAVLWRRLLEAEPVRPAGLGARDTLRLEAALLLNGQDMGRNTTPFDARLGWVVDLDRPDFVGRGALVQAKEHGPEHLLVGLATAARVIPRTGSPLLHDGETVGQVTSGSVSPVLGYPIALGYVPPVLTEPGTELVAQVREREVPMLVVQRPFYRRGITPVPASSARRRHRSEPAS